MNKQELLKQVWESCTFDEILQYGLEKMKITGSDIVDCASIYAEHEFSDDEIESVILDADIHIVMKALEEKYDVKDIIDELDEYRVLECFDSDDVFDYFSWELDNLLEKERDDGYTLGFDAAEKIHFWSENDYIEELRNGNINSMWCWLCNYFGLTYYDNKGLYNKLTELIRNLNKSMYKDRNEPQWINITLDR